jgi:UDP-3-O-[3-hydroxymyristoyl] glucosamine N-acyltransferase
MGVHLRKILEHFATDVSAAAGDLTLCVTKPAPLNALVPSAIAFSSAELSLAAIEALPAGTVLVCSSATAAKLGRTDIAVVATGDPRLLFLRIVAAFFNLDPPAPGVHPSAVIDPSAMIDPTAFVGPNVTIDAGCVLGPRSFVHAGAHLYRNVRIGADVTINSGAVIGAEGYGYQRNADNVFEKFPHIGGVVICDGVDIGANTCIDRGTLSDTIIGEGAKIDNQCHISHNAIVGRHCAIIAQSMVGGSVEIGDYAWLAPASIIKNKVRIGVWATVGMGAVVISDVADGQTVIGSPAVDLTEFRAARRALKSISRFD